jgi:hypothetical protein
LSAGLGGPFDTVADVVDFHLILPLYCSDGLICDLDGVAGMIDPFAYSGDAKERDADKDEN